MTCVQPSFGTRRPHPTPGNESDAREAFALTSGLSVASRQGRLREAVVSYAHPHVLVVDEVGYLAYGDEAVNVLYHVVNQRHLKRRSMVFTTNKSLDAWCQVLHSSPVVAPEC